MMSHGDSGSKNVDLEQVLRNTIDVYFAGEPLKRAVDNIRAGKVAEVREEVLRIIACRYHNGMWGRERASVVCVTLGITLQDLLVRYRPSLPRKRSEH